MQLNAAKYRDYIRAVKHLVSTIKIVNFIEENKNIVLVEFLNDEEIKFFLIRYNKLLFNEKYKLKDFSTDESKHKFKINIVCRFRDFLENSSNIGKNEIDEAHIIYSYLKSKDNRCKYISIPEQWIKDMNSLSLDRAMDEFIIDNFCN